MDCSHPQTANTSVNQHPFQKLCRELSDFKARSQDVHHSMALCETVRHELAFGVVTHNSSQCYGSGKSSVCTTVAQTTRAPRRFRQATDGNRNSILQPSQSRAAILCFKLDTRECIPVAPTNGSFVCKTLCCGSIFRFFAIIVTRLSWIVRYTYSDERLVCS